MNTERAGVRAAEHRPRRVLHTLAAVRDAGIRPPRCSMGLVSWPRQGVLRPDGARRRSGDPQGAWPAPRRSLWPALRGDVRTFTEPLARFIIWVAFAARVLVVAAFLARLTRRPRAGESRS